MVPDYQAMNARHACLQASTLLCAYAAAGHQKHKLSRSQALTLVAAAVLLGDSAKADKPLDKRVEVLPGDTLVPGVALATACKTLAKGSRTRLMISNSLVKAFIVRVAAIDVDQDGAEAEVNALYNELAALKDSLTPQDLICVCTELFPKARPFSYDDFEHSITVKLQYMHRAAIERLSGWEKATAQMDFYELANKHRICFPKIEISEKGLNAAEVAKRQEWLDTTGLWMTQRWAICTLAKESLEGKLNELKELIESPCRLTYDQKMDLWDEYRARFRQLMGKEVREVY